METIEIWNNFSEELRGYLAKKTRDTSLAEDLLHETFIKVHLNSSTLKSADQVKFWLYRIADNTFIDYHRKKALPAGAAINGNEEPLSHTAEDCLLPLIKNLPSKYREAIILCDIRGLKQHTVAQILGISLSGAKSRIQRGRKLIQQGFVDCCNYTINKKGLLIGDDKTEEECKVCS